MYFVSHDTTSMHVAPIDAIDSLYGVDLSNVNVPGMANFVFTASTIASDASERWSSSQQTAWLD